MPVPISALYAAAQGLVGVVLQQLVGRERLRAGASLYDGGDQRLAVAVRRHANWTEQVPFVLLLLLIIELNGAPAWLLHALGLPLLGLRIVHPFGLRFDEARVPARFAGALGTLVVLLVAIGVAAWQGLGA